MGTDYTTVTEVPGAKAPKEQLLRLYHRYHFASQFCKGKDVLELACGAGMGLGHLARSARKVVSGDVDEKNLQFAIEHYKGRGNIQIKKIDAHSLPCEDNSFDVIILYGAVYYLSQPERFVEEAHRALRKDGVLLICTVNCDWTDFNPSPHSIKYFSAPELYQLLVQKLPEVELYGSFPTAADSARDKITSLIKRTAVKLGLIPKSMKGKELFKRFFFGELTPLPAEIMTGMAEYSDPIRIPCDPSNHDYKVLYAVGRRCA